MAGNDTRRRRRRWRWLQRIAMVFAVLFLAAFGAALGLRAYFFHVADQNVEAVTAELDRADPGWRWEDILAARAAIPDEENSMPHVIASARHIPKNWPTERAAPKKAR